MEVWPLLVTLLVTASTLLFLQRIAPKIGLMDEPGGRKTHVGSVPLVGGIAMFVGFSATILILPFPVSVFKPLLGCMLGMMFVGVGDDLHELTAYIRLFGQMIVALLAIYWGGIQLSFLGNLFGDGNIILSPLFGMPIFSILAILSFVNASNMLDGADGLAAGVGAIQLGFLAFIAYGHDGAESMVIISFLACVLVFLVFNFPYCKRKNFLFMGDAGSLLIGFVTAWFAIHLSQASQINHAIVSPVTYLWITAVPLLDFFSVTIHRLRAHQSPMYADRRHWHHMLSDKNWSPMTIALLSMSLSFILSLIGLTLFWCHVGDNWSFAAFVLLLGAYVFARR